MVYNKGLKMDTILWLIGLTLWFSIGAVDIHKMFKE